MSSTDSKTGKMFLVTIIGDKGENIRQIYHDEINEYVRKRLEKAGATIHTMTDGEIEKYNKAGNIDSI